MDVRIFFQKQKAHSQQQFSKRQNTALWVAGIRVGLFIISLITFVYFVNQRKLDLALIALLVFLVAFIILVKWHNRLKFSRDQHKFLVEINDEELARLEGDLSMIDNGAEFAVKDHAYAEDLDILGDNSLFQLLNRTSTFPGRKLLAERLLGEKSKINFTKRQASLTNLLTLPEFMQEYQALGRHVKATQKDFVKFNDWLSDPAKLTGKSGLKILIVLLPVLFLLGVAITTLFSITYYALLPLIIINIVLLAPWHKYATDVVEKTSKSLKMLTSFVHHIELVESQAFSSDLLTDLAERFKKDKHDAKKEINKIAALLENLQVRHNIFHVFINIPLLLDLHWLTRIEQWQTSNREHVQDWFATLAEFEVMISLAGQAFANEDWCLPEVSQEPYILTGEEIGHPLIHQAKRVTNSFTMQGEGEVILLTGPNMAGKSTFLRTIGVNVILAQMGGVVCATKLVFNPEVQVFTAMRVKDDLSESISSFYAELSRIQQLLELVKQEVPVLYFLDEILKGTNSADRHKGAEALIKQLSDLNVSGFVSTHDLALGEMAKKFAKVENYSFESIIKDGNIDFDYKLREGICTSFNACELMRQMGIKV